MPADGSKVGYPVPFLIGKHSDDPTQVEKAPLSDKPSRSAYVRQLALISIRA